MGYFLLIYLDLNLVQYLHGNTEEEKYTRKLIKKKRNFQNNESIRSRFKNSTGIFPYIAYKVFGFF